MSKHYTAEKYIEWNVHDPEWRDGLKAKTRSEVKTRYRRRERAALKRSLAAEVEVELDLMELAESEAAELESVERYYEVGRLEVIHQQMDAISEELRRLRDMERELLAEYDALVDIIEWEEL